MNFPGLVLRNAIRSKRRTFLTAASVGLSVFLLITLLTLMRELTTPIETDASVRRLVVRHKAGLTSPLPRRYMEVLKQMPDLEYVTPLSWFGGTYVEPKNFFPRFAVDPENVFQVVSETQVAPETIEKMKRQRNAAVVGKALMKKFGWKEGEKITIKGDIYPVDLELEVVGTMFFDGLEDVDDRLWFNHQYLDDLLGTAEEVGTIWVVVRDEKDIPEITKRIDDRFANTEAETKTQTEKQFALGFVAMLGNIKLLIGSICTVVVFTLFIVVASTISMTIRERGREIAVLKTLGMARPLIFSLLISESVAIAMSGGIAGLLVAWVMYSNVDMQKVSKGFLFKFEVTMSNSALCLMIAACIGLFSCVVPAWGASRKTVLEGLRDVE